MAAILNYFRGDTGRPNFNQFPFAFILQNPPKFSGNYNSIKQCKPNVQIANQIANIIIDYNQKKWNFGNIISDQMQEIAIHPLMTQNTYDALIGLQENYNPQQYFHPFPQQYSQIYPQQSPNIQQYYSGMQGTPQNPNVINYGGNPYNHQYNPYYQNKLAIINEIKPLLQNNPQCVVNTFINVSLANIFPKLPGSITNITLQITLLGLAALIGAEHLVIFFLKMGADPSYDNIKNKDSAYNLLHTQLGLHFLLRSQSRQQFPGRPIGMPNQFLYSQGQFPHGPVYSSMANPKQINQIVPMYYFIVDQRIEFILTLLGSVGNGVDLSQIVPTETPVQFAMLGAQPTTKEMQSNILCQLAKEDVLYNTNFVMQSSQSLANGPFNILNFVLQFNKVKVANNTLNLFSNINAQTIPFGYTPLFYLLGNRTLVNWQQKLHLVELMINAGANPTIMPDIGQNLSKKNSPLSGNVCQMYHFYYQGALYEQLNQVLAKSKDYNSECNTYSTQNSNLTVENLRQQLRDAQLKIAYQAQIIKKLQSSQQIAPMYSNVAPIQSPFQGNTKMANNEVSGYTSGNNSNNENYNNGRETNYSTAEGNLNTVYSPRIPSPSPVSFRGGKEIKLRTFHFPKQRSYQERAFKATRPKTAAENAYDFIKTHYKITGKEVVFTIEDREKKRKYKYSAKTLKNGTDVLKSLD